MDKLSITQWEEDDRPREKLMRLGPEALSNAELMAILIGSGTPEDSAVDLIKRLLNYCNNNLNTRGKRSISQLMEYKGVGPAKAVTIMAACELGKRRQMEKAEVRPKLDSAEAIYQYMHPKMQDLDVEEAWALLMNQNFNLLKAVRLSHGGISETAVDVRIILKEALLANATIVAICHNHPSNNPQPSHDDDNLTQRMKKACELMRIYFADHIIVTDGNYYSYQEQGRL